MSRKKSRRKDVNIPVASMGDIAFLLIIFFMVCSNFIKESSMKLEAPTARDLEKVEESPISVAITEDGTIRLNGTDIGKDPEAVEHGVLRLIKGKKTPKGWTVLFKCDKRVDKSVFEPVLNALAETGARITAVGEKLEN